MLVIQDEQRCIEIQKPVRPVDDCVAHHRLETANYKET